MLLDVYLWYIQGGRHASFSPSLCSPRGRFRSVWILPPLCQRSPFSLYCPEILPFRVCYFLSCRVSNPKIPNCNASRFLLNFYQCLNLGLGGAPGRATRFSELKERGGGGTGGGLGRMKDGTLREIDPQSLISQLPGNFMIWLMLEFFFSIDFSKKKEFLWFKLSTTFIW